MQSQKRRRVRERERQQEAAALLSEPTAAPAPIERRTLILAALLIVATVLVYLQAWRFGFVMIDDPVYVSENPHVRGGLSLENAAWSFTTFRDGNWIPFTWLSLMLDSTLFGFHAGGVSRDECPASRRQHGVAFRRSRAGDRQRDPQCVRGGTLCAASAARRVGCLDHRAERRVEHAVWASVAVDLRALCTVPGPLEPGRVFCVPGRQPAFQADAGDSAVRFFAS